MTHTQKSPEIRKNFEAGYNSIRLPKYNADHTKLPAFGRAILERRQRGEFPAIGVIWCSFGWPQETCNKWEFAILPDHDVEATDLRLCAGLDLLIRGLIVDGVRALALANNATQWARSVFWFALDAEQGRRITVFKSASVTDTKVSA
jgi:hypothetical protein